MKNFTCLFLCDVSTVMAQPWASAGYECWCVDLQHEPGISRDGNIVRVGCDLLHWIPPRRDYRFAFAFPPCTNPAVSGARWFKDKGLAGLASALHIVERCRDILEWCECPWGLENPISTLSTYWREPDYKFDPADYGDGWTKRTCIWAGNGFVMPPKNRVEITQPGRIHRMPPGPMRAKLRSETPAGFARAVFEANR